MTKDTVVAFRAPEGFSLDPLTDLLRQGARELIAQAVEAELNAFLTAHADQTDAAGRRRLVRHGHLPEREVQTGIGAVPVKVPRVRDRAPEGRCCTTLTVRDSHRESMRLDRPDEQADTRPLPHDELVQLY
ncbi:MAG: transposase, partial [Gemmobacter sp.]|uniref:transposase n=1 Tax=Gemmobacter sp. TaxID=1898957 RepID=UPI00391BD7F2